MVIQLSLLEDIEQNKRSKLPDYAIAKEDHLRHIFQSDAIFDNPLDLHPRHRRIQKYGLKNKSDRLYHSIRHLSIHSHLLFSMATAAGEVEESL